MNDALGAAASLAFVMFSRRSRRVMTSVSLSRSPAIFVARSVRFARTLFEQALNRQALRLSLDDEQSLDALDREAVMTLTADDIAEPALALGEEPEPETDPTPEREQSRWWRWLV